MSKLPESGRCKVRGAQWMLIEQLEQAGGRIAARSHPIAGVQVFQPKPMPTVKRALRPAQRTPPRSLTSAHFPPHSKCLSTSPSPSLLTLTVLLLVERAVAAAAAERVALRVALTAAR